MGTHFEPFRGSLDLAGVHYRRGDRIDVKALRALKGAVLHQLLTSGRIVEVEEGAALSPALSASRVNVRVAAKG